jgi:hypothetical protein
MDRRLRAFVLVLSEYTHEASEIIRTQRDIIENDRYLLEITLDGESYEIFIIRNIESGRRRDVYYSGVRSINEIMLSPFYTTEPFTTCDAFVRLTETMNIPKNVYCIELRWDGFVFAYFMYDGKCYAIANDDRGEESMNITLDDKTAFQVMKDAYEKYHFRIGELLRYNGMLNY